MMACFFSA